MARTKRQEEKSKAAQPEWPNWQGAVLEVLTQLVSQVRALNVTVTQVGFALASGAGVRNPEPKDKDPEAHAERREPKPEKPQPTATLEDARRAILTWMKREGKSAAEAKTVLVKHFGVDAASKLDAQSYARAVEVFE